MQLATVIYKIIRKIKKHLLFAAKNGIILLYQTHREAFASMRKDLLALTSAAAALIASWMLAVGVFADDELILSDFGSGSDGWRRGDNIKAVEAVTDKYDRECLEVIGYDLDVNLVRTVSAEFEDAADLSEYQSFAYDICVPPFDEDPDAEYFTRVILTSGDGSSAEDIIEVSAGVWTEARLNISTWPGRSDVVSAKISLIVSTNLSQSRRNSFFIDNVRAEDKIDRAHTDRFMIDGFAVSGGSAEYDDEAGRLNITLSESEQTMLDAVVFPYSTEWETDRLRIRIENSSDVDTLTICYSTYDTGALSEDKSVSVRLDRQSQLKSYYVDLGDLTKLRSVSLRLPEGQGSLSISSICPVSQYTAPKYQVCGNITGCSLTDDLRFIRFTGDIGREEALSNQSGTLRIYAVEPGTAPDEIDLDAEPLLESPMTTKFDLTLDISESESGILAKQFAAFSLRPDGSAVLIAPPFYLSDPGRAAQSSASPVHGKKGVITGDISRLGELRADVTILTFDVSEAFAKRGRGETFEYRGKTYYMDQSRMNELFSQVGALNGSGVGVILRLTGWSETFEAELTESYAVDGYVSYSEYNSSPDGTDYLSALCAYIAGSCCLDGSIEGIILGECENFLGPEDGRYTSLNAMAEGVALALRRIYNSLMEYNSAARVYISISACASNELAGLTSEVGADELLPAVCAEINACGSFDWGICVEDFFRFSETGTRAVSAFDCSELVSILRGAGVYDTHMIFCDSNYALSQLKLSDKLARLVESYYSAVFSGQIDAVFCSLPQKDEGGRLADTVKLVDSADSAELSELALSILEISDWKERIEGFDPQKLPSKATETAEASETQPSGIKGSYGYFRFDSFSGVTGFEPGFWCNELSVVGGDAAKLRAKLGTSKTAGSAAYMSIVRRYEYPENFSLTPVLAVTIGLESTSPSRESARVRLVLTSGTDRFESEMTLAVGSMSTFYIDISGFSGVKDVDGIQLIADGDGISSAVLTVGGIDGLSRDYNDESLESVISEERAKKRAPESEDAYRAYLWIGGGVIVGVATALTIILLSRKKEDSDEQV